MTVEQSQGIIDALDGQCSLSTCERDPRHLWKKHRSETRVTALIAYCEAHNQIRGESPHAEYVGRIEGDE